MPKQAVLLLAHGTPDTVAQIPAYLRNVTGGRPLPPEVIEEIQRRYALIGHSPLTEITLEQARLVEAELAPGASPSMQPCATGIPILLTLSARCAPMASRKPPSSALRRKTRAPASASIAAPLNSPACASTSPKAGPIIHCSSPPLPSAFARLEQAQRGGRRARSRPFHRAQRPRPHRRSNRRPSPPIPMPASQTHSSINRRTPAGDSAMVLRLPEPGRKRRTVARPHRRADPGIHRRLRRKDRSAPACRLSLRSRGNSLRRGHIFPRIRQKAASSPGAPGIPERLGYSCQSHRRSGAPRAGAA